MRRVVVGMKRGEARRTDRRAKGDIVEVVAALGLVYTTLAMDGRSEFLASVPRFGEIDAMFACVKEEEKLVGCGRDARRVFSEAPLPPGVGPQEGERVG